jgi:phosphoribosylaminoimidazole-succinocarboxamide synthase
MMQPDDRSAAALAAAPLDDATLERGLKLTLEETHFQGLGQLSRGKVRDSYLWGDPPTHRAIVVSDRISAFDHILGTVPFKGQVLSGISQFWFDKTRDICPNHQLSQPDPVVAVVRECRPFMIEMVVRGYLTGSSATSILTHYQQGARSYCGHRLPEGLRAHQVLPTPLVTPTTKAAHGDHDEPIAIADIAARGLASEAQVEQLCALCLDLFRRGQELAAERGLILVDTKYELGLDAEDRIVVIDELHTPDSSRYWYADSYDLAMSKSEAPRALDKEFVRRALVVARGFTGQGEPPPLDRELRLSAAQRYAELYQQVTGLPFEPNLEPPLQRIETSLRPVFESLLLGAVSGEALC